MQYDGLDHCDVWEDLLYVGRPNLQWGKPSPPERALRYGQVVLENKVFLRFFAENGTCLAKGIAVC
jgi:hypothetical protein